ncbi:MAG: hypothetical protein ABR540_14095 [Acidimicrobiales bacterium]
MSAWAEQRACYSRARRGRFERGAQLGECALIEAMAFALGRRENRSAELLALPPARVAPATAA